MTRYTPERGYGLDSTGPEPVWRGKRPGRNRNFARIGYFKNYRKHAWVVGPVYVGRQGLTALVPRYRIDEYIQRGLIDPARRDKL